MVNSRPANAEDVGDMDGFDPWGWEDPLEEEMTTQSGFLAGIILWTEDYRSWWTIDLGVPELDMIKQLSHVHIHILDKEKQ